jgi:hypothetical protein
VLNYIQEYRHDYSAIFCIQAGQKETLELSCFNMSTVDEHAILSNDPALLFLKDFPAHPRQVIVLTLDCDKNGEGEGRSFLSQNILPDASQEGRGRRLHRKPMRATELYRV